MKSIFAFAIVAMGVLSPLLAQQSNKRHQEPQHISVYPPSAVQPSDTTRGQAIVDDTIKLSKAGFSDEVIIQQIKNSGRVTLSAGQLIQLRNASVSEPVLRTLLGGRVAIPPHPVAKSQPAPTSRPKINDGKIRVYVTDRPITEVISIIQGGSYGTASASGYAQGNRAAYSASAQQSSYVGGSTEDNRGGADPRTLEVSSDILEKCHVPNLVVTNDPDMADYIMDFRRQGGTRSEFFALGGLTGLAISSGIKVDFAALYAVNGDLIFASKSRTVGGAVNEVCSHFALKTANSPMLSAVASPVVTMAKFRQLDTGMSYRKAVAIIGAEGTEMSRSDLPDHTTVMYMWTNTNGSNMNAMFQNSELVMKAQSGLE
jgi:hypothetical protein